MFFPLSDWLVFDRLLAIPQWTAGIDKVLVQFLISVHPDWSCHSYIQSTTERWNVNEHNIPGDSCEKSFGILIPFGRTPCALLSTCICAQLGYICPGIFPLYCEGLVPGHNWSMRIRYCPAGVPIGSLNLNGESVSVGYEKVIWSVLTRGGSCSRFRGFQ